MSDDLGIGVLFEDIVSPSIADIGAVNIIYGSSGGVSPTAVLPNKFLTQNYPNIEDISELDERFGTALGAGDFNGDGRDYLGIGVPFETVASGPFGVGAINFIYGGSVSLTTTQSPVFDQFFSQDSPDIGLAGDFNDQFGSSLG